MAASVSLVSDHDPSREAAGFVVGGALSLRQVAQRWLEIGLLFVGLPIAYWLHLFDLPREGMLIVLMTAATVGGLWLLFRGVHWRQWLQFPSNPRRELLAILRVFAFVAVALTVLLIATKPQNLLSLPMQKPTVWLAIMLFYPLLSVTLQELIYRGVAFHRYRPLFDDGAVGTRQWIVLNAVLFGVVHIIFGDQAWETALAVGLSAAGGALFAWRYVRTRSLPLVAIEHALYGCFVFTIGWGELFYIGANGRNAVGG